MHPVVSGICTLFSFWFIACIGLSGLLPLGNVTPTQNVTLFGNRVFAGVIIKIESYWSRWALVQ